MLETLGLAGQEAEMGGMEPQRVASCLEVLGALLALARAPAIAACMVVADKRRRHKPADGTQDIVQSVANILGSFFIQFNSIVNCV